MTAVPNTYSEWVTVLTDFKNKKNDEDVLRAMKAGSIQWQSGVAERFSRKLIEAVNFRMNAASDKFQKDLSRSHGQEGAIVQAILSLRKEMAFLANAIDLPALPDDERKHYLKPEQEVRNYFLALKILRKMTEAEECPALSEITG